MKKLILTVAIMLAVATSAMAGTPFTENRLAGYAHNAKVEILGMASDIELKVYDSKTIEFAYTTANMALKEIDNIASTAGCTDSMSSFDMIDRVVERYRMVMNALIGRE